MIAMDLLVDLAEPRTVPLLAPIVRTVNRFHHERRGFTQLAHRVGDPVAVPALVEVVHKLRKDSERYAVETLAQVVLALGDLGDSTAVPALRTLLGATHSDSSSDAPIGLRDAVLFALAELGASDVLPQLLERADTPEIYASAGLRWAIGRLAANTEHASRVRQRLDAVRISKRMIESDGVETYRSIDSILATDMDQSDDIAAEIALEHSLVLLGDDDTTLVRLVTTALGEWVKREQRSAWRDRRLPAWALLAHARMPSLPRELARSIAASTEAPLRTLALRALQRA